MLRAPLVPLALFGLAMLAPNDVAFWMFTYCAGLFVAPEKLSVTVQFG